MSIVCNEPESQYLRPRHEWDDVFAGQREPEVDDLYATHDEPLSPWQRFVGWLKG